MVHALTSAADQAYLLGMAHAVEVGVGVLVLAIVVAFQLLPAQVEQREKQAAREPVAEGRRAASKQAGD